MKTEPAPDVKKRIAEIVDRLGMSHIDSSRLVCMRSRGSTSRAIARIWSLPKIWQKALDVESHYIIEVVSERFDKLSADDRDRTLIHELAHIPKTFSGAVLSHNSVHFDGCGGFVRRRIDSRTVEKMFRALSEKEAEIP
jgi:predicted metallopeptidase